MAVASRPRPGWDWHTPWFFALIGALLLIVSGLGIGFGTGLLGRGGTSPPPPVAHSPTPPPPSPVQSPTPSPAPVVSPSPASVVASLHGKIAVSTGQPGSGGWISFPSGQYTADSGSNVTLPGLTWAQGLTHSLALNRWLPVPRDQVTPDGKSYVYADGQTVWLVAAGQAPRSLKMPVLGSYPYWTVLAAESSGVYITPPPYEASVTGLYRLGYTGDPRLITSKGYWTATDGVFAYGTLTRDVPQGAATTIVKLNIATGAITTVFTQPSMRSSVVGFDAAGAPVILALESKQLPTLAQIWLASAGGATKLYETTVSPQPSMGMGPTTFSVFSVVADSKGTWIATTSGLYLYSQSAGWELASPVTGPLASAFRPA